jgi:hypothetical protein
MATMNATVKLDDRMKDVRDQLVKEFSGRVAAETVLTTTSETFDRYRSARVSDFVPLFVHLEVRRRLIEMSQAVTAG